MLVRIPQLLKPAEVARCRATLETLAWVDGKATAGAQSAVAKHNLQIPQEAPEARQLGETILQALGTCPLFISAALPLRVYPPLFNRYDRGMQFDAHVDNAIRPVPGANFRIRTDLSATLFLSEPADYEGGELVIDDTYGQHSVKLPAGDMVLYPATSLHRVTEVTGGSRWASFFWIQSMVKEDGQRTHLFELDTAIQEIRTQLPDDNRAVKTLTASYHNLLRRWAEL